MDASLLLQAGTVLVAGGAAWGGVKHALNGTRESVRSLHDKLDKHIDADNAVQTKMLEGLATLTERSQKPRARKRA